MAAFLGLPVGSEGDLLTLLAALLVALCVPVALALLCGQRAAYGRYYADHQGSASLISLSLSHALSRSLTLSLSLSLALRTLWLQHGRTSGLGLAGGPL